MPKPIVKGHVGVAVKIVAASLSAATAVVTIFTFARSYGLIGAPAPAALTVGNLGVSWVALSPAVDTAAALGDTVRLTATVADDNGTALIGATLHWTSDDPAVAQVLGGGRVLARRPGAATIIATAGDRIARARVVVRQHVASVRFEGDSAIRIGEDERRGLAVRALDARGNPVVGRRVAWRSLDTAVVSVDSAGIASARAQGTADVTAEIEGVSARATVGVVPVPGSLEVVAGAAQRTLAGSALAEPVVVRLLSTRGRPIPGAALRFRTADGRGAAEPALAVTDGRGVARTSWTLGALPGRQRLLVTNERLDSAAAVVAEAEPVAANTRLASLRDALVAPAGEPLVDTIGVRVTDTLGRSLADVPVTWTADDRGRVAPIADRTDSLGEARATWVLGPVSGVQHVRVRVGSGRSVPALAIAALATAGRPSAIAIVAGNAQKGRVGAALAKRVVLRVVDAAGNPVPGATLALHASAGELSDSVLATDSAGQARVAWTMPRAAGPQRLSVRAEGIDKRAELTAIALAAPPANVSFTEPEAVPVAGKPFGRGVSVTVTDVYDNPIGGAVVTFKAHSGATSPGRVVTDAKGVARTRWTLGSKPGDQTLTAAVASGDAGARSALTVTVGAKSATPVASARSGAPARHARSRERNVRSASESGSRKP